MYWAAVVLYCQLLCYRYMTGHLGRTCDDIFTSISDSDNRVPVIHLSDALNATTTMGMN